MSETPLVGKVMPRRGAARRASAAAAAQMGSSSESEREEEPEWNPGKAKAKARPSSGRLGKGRSTGNLKEQGRGLDLERRKSSPIKVTYSVKRKRRAAALADDADTTTSEDVAPFGMDVVESVSAPVPSRQRPRPRAKPKPKLKVSGTADRVGTSGLGDDEESDLTPLSSPTDLREVATSSAAPAVPAMPSRPLREHPMFTAFSKPSNVTKPSTPKKPLRETKEVEEGWELGQLGQHVWVRLDGKNSQTAGVFMRNSTSEETVWWPGFVLSLESKPPLKVKLYGDPSRRVTITEPCRENIRSRLINHSFVRFTCYEDSLQRARASGQANAGSSSPRKKGKYVDTHKAAWEKAKAMMHANANTAALEAEELPPPLVVVSTALLRTESQPSVDIKPAKARKPKSASRARKGKRKRAPTEEAEDDIGLDDEVGLVDENDLGDLDYLEAGDTCLAREKNGTWYWPTKVLECFPPSKRGEEARYKVLYLDYTEAIIPNSFIAAQGSREFATCKLGHVQSAAVDDTVDAEDEQEPADLRDPSPAPQSTVPPHEEFRQLDIREQLTYVKPVLRAVLRNEYAPTKAKFERFLANDKAFMSNLNQSSAMSGMMVTSEVTVLTAYLKWWALRGEVDTQNKDDAGVDEEEDTISVMAPESVATEPLPSIAPSSPHLSERTTSPATEPPPSSFVDLSAVSASQSTTKEDEHRDESDLMDTGEDEVEAPNTSDGPRRQTGSLGYEAMTAWRRLDFCLNILKQEAIRQILLWRRGERTSIELLSEEEEQRLHEKGQELLEEQDWVMDVIRFRKKEEAKLKADHPLGLRKDQTISKKGRMLTKKNYAESDSD